MTNSRCGYFFITCICFPSTLLATNEHDVIHVHTLHSCASARLTFQRIKTASQHITRSNKLSRHLVTSYEFEELYSYIIRPKLTRRRVLRPTLACISRIVMYSYRRRQRNSDEFINRSRSTLRSFCHPKLSTSSVSFTLISTPPATTSRTSYSSNSRLTFYS